MVQAIATEDVSSPPRAASAPGSPRKVALEVVADTGVRVCLDYRPELGSIAATVGPAATADDATTQPDAAHATAQRLSPRPAPTPAAAPAELLVATSPPDAPSSSSVASPDMLALRARKVAEAAQEEAALDRARPPSANAASQTSARWEAAAARPTTPAVVAARVEHEAVSQRRIAAALRDERTVAVGREVLKDLVHLGSPALLHNIASSGLARHCLLSLLPPAEAALLVAAKDDKPAAEFPHPAPAPAPTPAPATPRTSPPTSDEPPGGLVGKLVCLLPDKPTSFAPADSEPAAGDSSVAGTADLGVAEARPSSPGRTAAAAAAARPRARRGRQRQRVSLGR